MAGVVGSDVVTGIVSGATGPLLQPVIRRFELHLDRRRKVARKVPGLILGNDTHDCHNLHVWVPSAKVIISQESWLKEELRDKDIRLDSIAPVLIRYEYWSQRDATKFRSRNVSVLGVDRPFKRLGIILWGIQKGVLGTNNWEGSSRRMPGLVDPQLEMHDCDCVDTWKLASKSIIQAEPWLTPCLETSDSYVNLKDLAPVLRKWGYWGREDVQKFRDSQVRLVGAEDATTRLAVVLWGIAQWILRAGRDDDCDHMMGGTMDVRHLSSFGANEPQEGLPISMSKVELKLELTVQFRPCFRVVLPQRTIRDLGRLLYDRRGSFEVAVEPRWPPHWLQGLDSSFAHKFLSTRGLNQVIERFLTAAICFGSDRRYKRPVRPFDFLAKRLYSKRRRPLNMKIHDRTPIKRRSLTHRSTGHGKIFYHFPSRMPLQCLKFVEAYRSMGYPIESAHLDVGKLRVVRYGVLCIFLGEVTEKDVERCMNKLMSTRLPNAVHLCGWNSTTWKPDGNKGPFQVDIATCEEDSLRNFATKLAYYCTPVGYTPVGDEGNLRDDQPSNFQTLEEDVQTRIHVQEAHEADPSASETLSDSTMVTDQSAWSSGSHTKRARQQPNPRHTWAANSDLFNIGVDVERYLLAQRSQSGIGLDR